MAWLMAAIELILGSDAQRGLGARDPVQAGDGLAADIQGCEQVFMAASVILKEIEDAAGEYHEQLALIFHILE